MMVAATDNSHTAGEGVQGAREDIVRFDNYPQIRLTWIWLLAYMAIGGPLGAMIPLSVPFPPQFMDMVPLFIMVAVGIVTFSYQFNRTPKEISISKGSVYISWRNNVESFPISEIQWNGIPAEDSFFELKRKKANSATYYLHRDVGIKLFNHVFPEARTNWRY